MQISWMNFVCIIIAPSLCFAAQIKNNLPQKKPIEAFLSARDMTAVSSKLSNIVLYNTGDTTTVYGIYIRQLATVLPGQSCSSAVPIYTASENVAAGAVVIPVISKAHSPVPIGSNYLYNMIYSANYYVQVSHPSSPPGCALPGCSWGSGDSTFYNWCIYLGALAPVLVPPSYAGTNVPPSTYDVSTGSYNYNLSSNYSYVGPISCNDQTLTCATATPQSQSFSP